MISARFAFAALATALLAAAPAHAQTKLKSSDMVSSLQGLEATAPRLSAALLRRLADDGIKNPARANPVNREPLSAELEKLAQITVVINFDLNSARIRPDSYHTVGLIADSLYHPLLLGYRFLIVGHTDSTGNRSHNLKLSQERADAIRLALLNPFGIQGNRIDAVGLGEEQLLNRANPQAAENRRVQLINIGKQ
jgi:outer membrane protein OmpA-like peptidoglycan-associated protein